MNFKIIETPATMPDVLLHRDIDDMGNITVEIKAIGEIDGNTDMFASEQIILPNAESAQRFIQDYSELSAGKFCQRHNISY